MSDRNPETTRLTLRISHYCSGEAGGLRRCRCSEKVHRLRHSVALITLRACFIQPIFVAASKWLHECSGHLLRTASALRPRHGALNVTSRSTCWPVRSSVTRTVTRRRPSPYHSLRSSRMYSLAVRRCPFGFRGLPARQWRRAAPTQAPAGPERDDDDHRALSPHQLPHLQGLLHPARDGAPQRPLSRLGQLHAVRRTD